jgi:hypothetical protein
MSHLQDVNQGYWKHCLQAHGYAVKLAATAILAVVHAWIPNLLPHAVSTVVEKISKDLKC